MPYQQQMYRSSSSSHEYDGRSGFDSDMALVWVIVVGALVAILYFFTRKHRRQGYQDPPAYRAGGNRPPAYNPDNHVRMANAQLSKQDAAGRDYVLAIDVSGSMNTEDCHGNSRFREAAEGSVAFAHTIDALDPDGIDICFFNDRAVWHHNAHADVVEEAFRRVSPNWGTVLAPVLQAALDNYFEKRERPLTIVVITDGCPRDERAVCQTIVNASKKLYQIGGRDEDIGISFIQIGYDKGASEFLKMLDDDLQSKYGCPFDIVDTVPMDEVAKRGGVKQVLIDAVND